MSNERILSHKMSKKLSIDDVKNVSAGYSFTKYTTAHASYNQTTGWDSGVDFSLDF